VQSVSFRNFFETISSMSLHRIIEPRNEKGNNRDFNDPEILLGLLTIK